jgi:hypothetical protein
MLAGRVLVKLAFAALAAACATFCTYLILLLMGECRPSATNGLWQQARPIAWAVAFAAAAPILMLRARLSMLRAVSLVLSALSAGLLIVLGVVASRGSHTLCERVGHWAPHHIHRAHPAGDAGELYIFVIAGVGAAVGLTLGLIGLAIAWAANRKSTNPAI